MTAISLFSNMEYDCDDGLIPEINVQLNISGGNQSRKDQNSPLTDGNEDK